MASKHISNEHKDHIQYCPETTNHNGVSCKYKETSIGSKNDKYIQRQLEGEETSHAANNKGRELLPEGL